MRLRHACNGSLTDSLKKNILVIVTIKLTVDEVKRGILHEKNHNVYDAGMSILQASV